MGSEPGRQFADGTHVSGAAPRPFNHWAITRTCCAPQWRAEWPRATGLVINLETAKSLGLEVLPALTVR